MAKGDYIPKDIEENVCMVMFPSTKLGRPTRASLQSLIKQLETRFSNNYVVRSIEFQDVAGMKQMKLKIDRDTNSVKSIETSNNVLLGGTVNNFVEHLRDIERDVSNHISEKVILDFDGNQLSTTYKPHIQIVPQQKITTELLILIDGSNVLATGYHATKKNMLKSQDGLYTNAVYIMVQKVLDILTRTNVTHMAIAWDEGRDKTFRRKMYPNYKANRSETDSELKQQFATARNLFSEIGIAQYSHEEIEADDVIGTINSLWQLEKGSASVGIISNDKDLFQLISDSTLQLISKNNKEYRITPSHLKTKWNVTPSQWADCKALLGDKSDNIPGCSGVGEKAAYPLIAQYGNLETLYEKLDELKASEFKRYVTKLEDGKRLTMLSKQLAQIRCNADDLLQISSVDELKLNLNKNKVIHQFKLLGFKSLINSIEKGMFRIG